MQKLYSDVTLTPPNYRGDDFWITCKELAFLSSVSQLQVIWNKRPWCWAVTYVTAGWNYKDLQIQKRIVAADTTWGNMVFEFSTISEFEYMYIRVQTFFSNKLELMTSVSSYIKELSKGVNSSYCHKNTTPELGQSTSGAIPCWTC